jgi:hypothetical protein
MRPTFLAGMVPRGAAAIVVIISDSAVKPRFPLGEVLDPERRRIAAPRGVRLVSVAPA